LKEARKLYHQTGELKLFRFTEVYKDEPYFYKKKLTDDHVFIISLCEADRKNLTYEKILRNYWNNLRSPACPSNYLDNKVVPCGIDAYGDIIYKYNPMPYEEKWVKEGMDLTR
jgi:hypothetical protein